MSEVHAGIAQTFALAELRSWWPQTLRHEGLVSISFCHSSSWFQICHWR